MKNVNELRNQLAIVFAGLQNGTIPHKDAAELANLAGKMINSAKVQVEYYTMRQESPEIDFLGCGATALPLDGKPKEIV
jgi:hypothetical protein